MYGPLGQNASRGTPSAPWFFATYAKNLVFYLVFGDVRQKCHWERGRGEGKPSPREGLTRTTKGLRMTGSAASAGRSMGGLFLEVYFKEVGGPGGGGGRDWTAIEAWRIYAWGLFGLPRRPGRLQEC